MWWRSKGSAIVIVGLDLLVFPEKCRRTWATFLYCRWFFVENIRLLILCEHHDFEIIPASSIASEVLCGRRNWGWSVPVPDGERAQVGTRNSKNSGSTSSSPMSRYHWRNSNWNISTEGRPYDVSMKSPLRLTIAWRARCTRSHKDPSSIAHWVGDTPLQAKLVVFAKSMVAKNSVWTAAVYFEMSIFLYNTRCPPHSASEMSGTREEEMDDLGQYGGRWVSKV